MRKKDTIDLTVTRLRARFWQLLPICGGKHRLAARLASINDHFSTAEGVYAIQNAKTDRAGEAAMHIIIAAMEQLSQAEQPMVSRAEKSLRNMGIASSYEPKYETTRKLQETFKAKKQ